LRPASGRLEAEDHPPGLVGRERDGVSRLGREAGELEEADRESPALGPGDGLLEEDLRSPCTEEIAVFRAFAETVAQGSEQFVVIDTAPTGHTLLLLDAAEAYHREVLRKAGGSPEAIQRLLPRLRDPSFTSIVLVTLPEATPIHEAMQLERDLARAGIDPYAWVVNQSLTPLEVTDPVLRARRAQEAPHLRELAAHAQRVVLERWAAAASRREALAEASATHSG